MKVTEKHGAHAKLPAALLSMLLILPILTGCGADATLPAEISNGIAQSEGHCEQITAIINWQLDGNAAYREQRDKFKESGDPRDEPQDTYDEVVVKYDELSAVMADLSVLKARADTLPPGGNDAETAIIQAARDYFAMLDAACRDLDAVFTYYFAMRDAMLPMRDFTAAENTTGYNDYALFAGQLSQVISQTQSKLESVSCPGYMSDSHSAFTARIDEFQSFCQDFSIAVQLSDPLRIASCNYRMQRLGLMLDKCDDALTDDFALQFSRVAERLNGTAAELRGELLAYV
ncbi:MAG: hypothetical protein LBL15_05315 [Oscillospiraceae bacterium]|jgi:hypothetical protein|nr:hypothetical protein [Oscillospiraceae bacterium]